MDALWQKELASQHVLAVREGQCIHGDASVRKAPGQNVSLASRARSEQEPLSRARCPSLVPAFIRCSESCATMALSQLFSPPAGFPTKLLFSLLQFPQHHLRNLSVSTQLHSSFAWLCAASTAKIQGSCREQQLPGAMLSVTVTGA